MKKELTQLLDFTTTTNGVVQVPKGFYRTVTIAPIKIDPTESEFYLDEVTYSLGPSPSGYISSTPIPMWGIDDFVGRIGTTGA